MSNAEIYVVVVLLGSIMANGQERQAGWSTPMIFRHGEVDELVVLVVSARNNETYASAVRIGVHEKSSGHPVE
jgi:hypothetical protein